MKRKDGKGVMHHIKEAIVDLKNGCLNLIFGDDNYPIRDSYVPELTEMINYMFIPIYLSIKKHSFDFCLQERTKTIIPRMFIDSRASHIKDEMLQDVIELLSEKFNYDVTNKC